MPTWFFHVLCLTLNLVGNASRKVGMPRLQLPAEFESSEPVRTEYLVHSLRRTLATFLLALSPSATFNPSIPGLSTRKAARAMMASHAMAMPGSNRPEAGMPAAGFHHIAFVTEDPCATRCFFEDVLGLPMVHCEGGPGLMHAFFDAGAGASMAFFSFNPVKPSVGTDLSVSLGVPKWLNRAAYRVSKEQAKAVRNRLQAGGAAEVIETSHGWCDSLYVMDPNGVMVELCVDTPGFIPDPERARQRWLAEHVAVSPESSSRGWGLRKMMSTWASSHSGQVPDYPDVSGLRGCNLSAGFHHLSFTTRDVAATRHFYEDLFGFPLVHCDWDRSGDSWIKTAFFDIGRGSFIAFQAFENIGEESNWHSDLNGPLKFPAWANHAAFRATLEEVQGVRHRMELQRISPIMEMSHGWCYSIYYRDPNGITVELCVDTPGFEPDRASAVQMWEASARSNIM
mmetsp:Transcript_102630/g.197034  ORF Transcript_102630/g.197034 Transcript_102630/m.197034 type:complete len:454 (-) Transcript_102630:107-1468(-)